MLSWGMALAMEKIRMVESLLVSEKAWVAFTSLFIKSWNSGMKGWGTLPEMRKISW